jgi:hypothetical protein
VSTRATIGIGLWLAWVVSAQAADDVTLTAQVDARQVGVTDQVELTISVSGRSVDLVEDITVPTLTNLRVVSGPHLSTQLSFVNGAISQSKTYTYVLQPRAVGKAEIGSARAQLRGGVVKTTAPIPIDVAAGSVRPAPAPQSDPSARTPSTRSSAAGAVRQREPRHPRCGSRWRRRARRCTWARQCC